MTTSPVPRNVAVERIGSGKFEATNSRGGRAALGGCTAIDVDILTSRRAEPESFGVLVDAAKIRDENGNRLTDIEITFRISFPAGEPGDEARAILPDVVKKSHDKLCTVGRTVELGTPIATRIE
jgi:putative redox protein